MFFKKPLYLAWEEYVNGTKHRFYTYAHGILLVGLYELLLRLAYNPRVAVYNGVDLWFKLSQFLPSGTLIISLPLMLFWGHRIYQDWMGRKSFKELRKDWSDARKNKGFIPKPKAPFRPGENGWWYFGIMIFEGFIYGSLTYLLLRWIIWLLLIAFIPDLAMPEPLDANATLQGYHTNLVQNLGLAFGAGFYEEALFRGLIFIILFRLAGWSPLFKKFKVETVDVDVIPFKLPKHKPKDPNYTFTLSVSILIYALSHYLIPFGDEFGGYSFLYRCCFGLLMYIIFVNRRFAVVAWTHAFYDLWYFILL